MNVFILIFTLFLLPSYGRARLSEPKLNNAQNIGKRRDLVQVELYYESLCPGSRTFYSEILAPAVRKIPKYLNVSTYPYGNAETKELNGHMVFICQHGAKECYGNKLHACAFDILNNNTKAILFNACTMAKDRSNRGSNDEAVIYCGRQMGHGMAPMNIINCAKSARGDALLKKAGDETQKEAPEALPYCLINGKECEQLHEFWSLVCKELKNAPKACKHKQ